MKKRPGDNAPKALLVPEDSQHRAWRDAGSQCEALEPEVEGEGGVRMLNGLSASCRVWLSTAALAM